MTTFALSTWSLHRTLDGSLDLLELPAALRQRGYDTVQICHFHLPSQDASYLAELRSALSDAEITLDAVLVDDGDLTHPTEADDQEKWIAGWLDTSAELGADRARVIAGKAAPTPERLTDSARRLSRLAAQASVRVVTENWLGLLPSAMTVTSLLDQTDGNVGFLIDLGNWTGATKYAELTAVAGRAETCHAKCAFAPPASGGPAVPDAEDYRACLHLLKDAGFTGPLALIYDGPDDDEWAALEQEKEIVRSVFG